MDIINNRPLHIAHRSSRIDPIIDNGLSDQFSIIESIFENRLSIIGSTSDVQGSIIVHDGTPYQTGRYITKLQKEESRQPDEVSPSS